MTRDLVGDRTVTGQLRGRAHILGHERNVGRKKAKTHDPSVASLREMRMVSNLWEPGKANVR